jgi:hypothetical protein
MDAAEVVSSHPHPQLFSAKAANLYIDLALLVLGLVSVNKPLGRSASWTCQSICTTGRTVPRTRSVVPLGRIDQSRRREERQENQGKASRQGNGWHAILLVSVCADWWGAKFNSKLAHQPTHVHTYNIHTHTHMDRYMSRVSPRANRDTDIRSDTCSAHLCTNPCLARVAE